MGVAWTHRSATCHAALGEATSTCHICLDLYVRRNAFEAEVEIRFQRGEYPGPRARFGDSARSSGLGPSLRDIVRTAAPREPRYWVVKIFDARDRYRPRACPSRGGRARQATPPHLPRRGTQAPPPTPCAFDVARRRRSSKTSSIESCPRTYPRTPHRPDERCRVGPWTSP